MGLAFEAVPIVTARRFCVERALSWEAEARSRAPNGELPFPGNAIEWESWRRPLADLLLHTGLLDPVRWESRRELEWPSGPALVALSGSEDESNSVGAADPAWTAFAGIRLGAASAIGRPWAYRTWEATRPRQSKCVGRCTP